MTTAVIVSPTKDWRFNHTHKEDHTKRARAAGRESFDLNAVMLSVHLINNLRVFLDSAALFDKMLPRGFKKMTMYYARQYNSIALVNLSCGHIG